MRAVEVLRTAIEENLEGVHQRRSDALWRAVVGLVRGGQLFLTGLGRALPGETSDKHRIKAVDRLLGNQALHRELSRFYRAMALWSLKRVKSPVIAVDWTGAGAHHYELSAKLCSDGRALPLLSLVFAKHDYASRGAHRKFLDELANVLPEQCKPIILTDAGFYDFWFNAVEAHGWDYVGRIRGSIRVTLDDHQYTLKDLHRRADSRAKDLGPGLLGRYKGAQTRRVVLSKEPRLKGRRRITRRGKQGQSGTDRSASKAAREPWVLATSLQCNARLVVQLYSLRTQIEQSFRDRKNYRNGWSNRLANSRSNERMATMLLIGSLADLAVQLAGRALAGTPAARRFQANTVRDRRVLSYFFLGVRALRSEIEATWQELAHAAAALLATIRVNAAISTLE